MSYRLLTVALMASSVVFAMLSGLTSSASAREICTTDNNGKKHCFDYQPLPPDDHKLTPLALRKGKPPAKGSPTGASAPARARNLNTSRSN
jgi:hypothetical protein